MTSAHNFTSLHELVWNVLLCLRCRRFLVFSVLETLIRWIGNRLVGLVLVLAVYFSSVLNSLLLIFVASRALRLFSLRLATASIIAVCQMLGINLLGGIGRASQDETTAISLS